MAKMAQGVDYVSELRSIRETYGGMSPTQRLGIIRQRLKDSHFGPNLLVTSVSAVEALARTLVVHESYGKRVNAKANYHRYKNRDPKGLVVQYLKQRGFDDPDAFFGEDNWKLFTLAVEYRNLLAHECTYLGVDKFPSLIAACEALLDALVKLGKLRERQPI